MPGGRPRKLIPKWPPLPKRPYGTGSLSRNRAMGVIRARLPTGIDPKRSSREFSPDDAAGAGAWLDQQIARATTGRQYTPATTVRDWSGFWLGTYVEPFRSPNTVHLYRYALRQLEPVYAARLDALRPSDLQAVVGAVSARVGPSNLQNIVGVWRRCLDAAVEDELLAKNPAKRLVISARTKRPAVRMLPLDAFADVRDAIVGHRFEAAYALVLGCGLRIGEILGLHWQHVDLANKRAWIEHQYSNGRWIPLPKGKNPHWVSLPDFVVAALIRHRDGQPAGSTLVMQSPFRGKKSKRSKAPTPYSRNAVASAFAALLGDLGLDRVKLHAGRHTLASYWLDHGVPPTTIAERLGHADPSITLRVYTRPSQDGHDRADALVNELLDAPRRRVSGGET